MNSNPSVNNSIPAGHAHTREYFIGDGQKLTFDLGEVPSWLHALTARVSRPLYSIGSALVIGNFKLNSFAEGYDVLVDRLGKRIYLKHALAKGEVLLVEYLFYEHSQSPAVPAASDAQAEPQNIPGWEIWDYQNWRDIAAAMREGKLLEYAMCIWLLNQESNDMAFQDGQWSEWYHYARTHCSRFDRDQPRRR